MKRIFQFMMDGAGRWSILLFFTGTLSSEAYSQACDSLQCCEKSDLSPSGMMIGHSHPKGVWMLSYRYMSMQMRDNMSGTTHISDAEIFQDYIMAPQNMRMDMHMLMGMYGISTRFSVMLMLNYAALSMSMTMPPGGMHMHGMTETPAGSMDVRTSGLADTRLYATYSLVNKSGRLLLLSAGINFPTGSTGRMGDANSMTPGQRLSYMMQLGSGTFDLLPGITYVMRGSALAWGTQLTGILRPGYNRYGYAYGNQMSASSWLAWRFLPWMSASARAEGLLTGSISGKDASLFEIMEPAAKTANYGGTQLNAYAGVNIYLKRMANSKLSFEYGLPLYERLNGIHLATRGLLYAGWAITF